MKKKSILIVALLMIVGFAAVATNLLINGSTTIQHDSTEGGVIFSDASSDGTATISGDKKSITYKTSELSSVGDVSTVNFTIKNYSTQYDATVSITCTGANEYYTITPNADSYDVNAQTEVDGKVTVKLINVTTEDITDEFTCTLTSTAEERDTTAELVDAQTFCESLGFAYGMDNVQTYAGASSDDPYYEEGDKASAVYLCSGYEDFRNISGYDITGTLVYTYAN